MSYAHAASRHRPATYAGAPHEGHHAAQPTHVPWWDTPRAHRVARDIGDYVDDLMQWACVLLGVLLVVFADSVLLAVLWPVDPHLASGAFGLVLVVILAWIWHGRRRD